MKSTFFLVPLINWTDVLLMSWYLRAESPRPLVSLGVPTVLPGLDEVLYREAEERKQRQELREQEALYLVTMVVKKVAIFVREILHKSLLSLLKSAESNY